MEKGRKPTDYSDVIGKTFGELTILSYTEPQKENRYRRMCRCKCACGKVVDKRLTYVLNGKTKSCGHLRSEVAQKDYSDCIGKTFGDLTILSYSEPIKENGYRRTCLCRCSCGREKEFLLQNVLQGVSLSCGLGHPNESIRKDYSDIVGKTFGELTVLSYTEPLKENKYHRTCLCRCSCGKEVSWRLDLVLDGRRTTCGHIKVQIDTTPFASNKTTGIRNISWSNSKQKYLVSIKRLGRYFRGSAKTLNDAIKLKEEKLAESEQYVQELLKAKERNNK